MNYEFELPIAPVAKERPRLGKYTTYTPSRTREFTNQVRMHARKLFTENPYKTPIRVIVTFHLPRPKKTKFDQPAVRPDIDNYEKAIFDSLNEICWSDDCLICESHCKKTYALDKPKISIRIEEL